MPEEDLRTDLLEPSDTTTHCPFKGDATYRSLRVGDRVVTDAVWAYPTPIAGVVVAGRARRAGARGGRPLARRGRRGPRAPARPVPPRRTCGTPAATSPPPPPTARPWPTPAGGILLGETGLVDRFYIARDALRATLEPSEKRTVCPYKGVATYYSLRLDDGRVLTDAAWSYESPTDESRAIKDLVSLAHDDLVVTAS